MARDGSARNEGTDRSLLDRRSYLKLAGAAVGSAATMRFAGGVRAGNEYGTVVNVVKAGADPKGNEPINDVLSAHAADETLLTFPDGTYRIDEFTARNLTHFGMQATGDATLVFGDGAGTTRFSLSQCKDVLFEGFTVDATATPPGTALEFDVTSGLELRNIDVRTPRAHDAVSLHLSVDDGRAIVNNVSGTVVDSTITRNVTITGSGDRSTYSFSVNGTLEPARGQDGATVRETGSAAGAVEAGTHSYRFDGVINEFEVDGDATVLVDGKPANPRSLTAKQNFPTKITVDTTSAAAQNKFQIEAGDAVRNLSKAEPASNAISRTPVSGVVHTTTQYRVSGDLDRLSTTGDATLTFG